MSKFPRAILKGDAESSTCQHLQKVLVDLVDLALQLKQAHWNVVGRHFKSVHEQLDEILLDVRNGSDEVAERIVTIGSTADGRAATLAEKSRLANYPETFNSPSETVKLVADRLSTTVDGIREAIQAVGDLDPVSEDLLISISAPLEKHLWMVQAQEVD